MGSIDPTILVAAFLIMAALAFGLWVLPGHYCSECTHCANLKREKEVREHDRFHDYYHIPKPDPKCNRCNGGMR